jgi:hypothetical protein
MSETVSDVLIKDGADAARKYLKTMNIDHYALVTYIRDFEQPEIKKIHTEARRTYVEKCILGWRFDDDNFTTLWSIISTEKFSHDNAFKEFKIRKPAYSTYELHEINQKILSGKWLRTIRIEYFMGSTMHGFGASLSLSLPSETIHYLVNMYWDSDSLRKKLQIAAFLKGYAFCEKVNYFGVELKIRNYLQFSGNEEKLDRFTVTDDPVEDKTAPTVTTASPTVAATAEPTVTPAVATTVTPTVTPTVTHITSKITTPINKLDPVIFYSEVLSMMYAEPPSRIQSIRFRALLSDLTFKYEDSVELYFEIIGTLERIISNSGRAFMTIE